LLYRQHDNTHLSSRPKLEALPLLTYILGKERFRDSEVKAATSPLQAPLQNQQNKNRTLMTPYQSSTID